MRTILASGLLLISLQAMSAGAEPPPAAKPTSSCIVCHSELEGEAKKPVLGAVNDIHFIKGLGCESCHGGNPAAGADGDFEAAHDASKKFGFKGKPKRLDVPVFCGTCHADAGFMKRFNPQMRVDQLAEYRTSMHGKQNAIGDDKVAICTDCHGVHGIRAVKDPASSVYTTHVAETCARCHTNTALMHTYKLPSNQFADYKTSVHARALYEKGDTSAPSCKNCHGNHGAVPPGVESVANVCGSCHGREATLFRETEAKKKISLINCIQCAICHGNHAVQPPNDEMVGVGPKSTCTSCHPPGVPTHEKVREMAAALEGLKKSMAEATDLLGRAERAGVEVSADRFALQTAQDRLVDIRVLVHSFDLERFLVSSNEGLAASKQGIVAGRRALAEIRTRRVGLGISLIVIVAVMAGIAAKVREIEKP
jgi:Cytochrome c3